MTKRRNRGRLRPVTDTDRARKAARNERRDRAPARPVAAGAQLVAIARPAPATSAAFARRVLRAGATGDRGLRSFVGRNVRRAARAERRRARKQGDAIAHLAKKIPAPTRRAA